MALAYIDVLSTVEDALKNGVDASGAPVNPTVAPTYGGTDVSEAFEGIINVYRYQVNETIDIGSVQLPAFAVVFDLFPPSVEMYGDEPFGLNLEVHIMVNDHFGHAVEGADTYYNKEAVNVLLPRLKELLQKMRFPTVKLLSRKIASPLAAGDVETDNFMLFMGSCGLNIEFVEEI